jgi:hypothetical protein
MLIKKMDSKQKEIAELTALLKGRLQTAKTLVRFHKPKKIDVKARFGLSV